ncbi:MAG: succinate dehydrogenase iron-sulfur subunit [Spirochaetia bacterium]|jgi:succinate dehydrogenase / fumarate reductase iron-sulfur subunit
MKLLVDVRRFDPRSGAPSYEQQYEVEAEPTDRLLDVLLRIKSLQDASLSFRYSCAHGVCGSDAMRINGKERLACKTLVRDVAGTDEANGQGAVRVQIEPLRHLPVLRDLIVDQAEFFRRSLTVTPFLLPAATAAEKEILQAPQQQHQFEDATKCINCAACFSACPVLEKNPRFLGPAAIVQAARFVEDSRDWGLAPRLDALDTPDGIWGCENHFECTRVCPREIKVTKLINLMKRRVTKEREKRGETVHDSSQKGA